MKDSPFFLSSPLKPLGRLLLAVAAKMGKKKASSQASPERHEPIVDGVVRLYSSNGEATDAIDQLYAEQAQFATPELTVEGKEAIKLVFGTLALLFRKTVVEVNSSADTPTGIAIDMVVTYFPRFLPDLCKIEIRQWTTLELNESRQITRHVDRWSLPDMLSHTTLLGSMYDKIRTTGGCVSTMAFKGLLMLTGQA